MRTVAHSAHSLRSPQTPDARGWRVRSEPRHPPHHIHRGPDTAVTVLAHSSCRSPMAAHMPYACTNTLMRFIAVRCSPFVGCTRRQQSAHSFTPICQVASSTPNTRSWEATTTAPIAPPRGVFDITIQLARTVIRANATVWTHTVTPDTEICMCADAHARAGRYEARAGRRHAATSMRERGRACCLVFVRGSKLRRSRCVEPNA